jgi:hypothetical protein
LNTPIDNIISEKIFERALNKGFPFSRSEEEKHESAALIREERFKVKCKRWAQGALGLLIFAVWQVL